MTHLIKAYQFHNNNTSVGPSWCIAMHWWDARQHLRGWFCTGQRYEEALRCNWAAFLPPWPAYRGVMWLATAMDRVRNAIVPPQIRMVEHSMVFARTQVCISLCSTCVLAVRGSSALGLLPDSGKPRSLCTYQQSLSE